MGYFKLTLAALFPVAFTVLFALLEKKTKFGKLKYYLRQGIIGVVFGGFAILSTEFSIDLNGAMINARDAAPLAAGLLFGAPAGMLAGVIGGLYRFFAVYWGAGTFTQIGCSVACLVAGVSGGLCRKFMFGNKNATWYYALALGIVTEVLHMLIVFLTNMQQLYMAFTFVKMCTVPMIVANAVSVTLSTVAANVIDRWSFKIPPMGKKLVQKFQLWLLICVAVAFGATSVFTYFLETGISNSNADSLIQLNIDDVRIDILDATSEEELTSVANNRHIGKDGGIIICNSDGIIVSDKQGHRGENIFSSGIFDSYKERTQLVRFSATVYGVESYCIYDFCEGYYIIGILPVSEAEFTRDITVYVSMFMEILIYAALFVHLYFLIKKLVANKIDKVNQSLAAITGGNLEERVDVRSSEEFSSLSDYVNSTVDTLKTYIKEAEERIDKELEFARQIQLSALPSMFPPYPHRKDFEIYASMDAAKEVGGDFYDFYMLGRDHVAITVADVSGKGIPAAMFMMRAKTLIKSFVESGHPIDETFSRTNESLCENNTAGMFLTAWFGILDLNNGELSFVNAGHNPPLIKRADGQFEYLKVRPNFVLAGMEGAKYRKNTITLNPGDSLFIYTDGVTEAMTSDGSLFGEERLKDVLNSCGEENCEALCKATLNSIVSYADGAPQSDDITMLSLKYIYRNNGEGIEMYPDRQSIETVRSFAEKFIEDNNIPVSVANKLYIAIDEIYSNIVYYSGATKAEMGMSLKGGKVTLSFKDNGKPFNPLNAPEPDITLSSEERELGGLGIFMVKKTCKELKYSYENDSNVVVVVYEIK
ncbi:MAG: SpoIIE family protein phosphatase [Candidatus Coproplasma sp.]